MKIGLLLGIPSLQDIFDETHYTYLRGGILESFATLFSRKVKLMIYPTLRADETIYTCANFEVPDNLKPLYQYLVINDKIEAVSYTHLDVYKRQTIHEEVGRLCFHTMSQKTKILKLFLPIAR